MPRSQTIITGGFLFIVLLGGLAVYLMSGMANGTAHGTTVTTVGAVPSVAAAVAPDPTATPDGTIPVVVPAVEPDPISQLALDYTLAHVTIKSGAPQVLLSVPVVSEKLNTLDFGVWTFEQGCAIPMQVVILHGDFDVRPAIPASLAEGQGLPASYLVFVYDTRIREFISLLFDPNGGLVKRALGNPALPDPDPSYATTTYPMPIPCDPTPVEAPGVPEDVVRTLESTPPPTR